MAHFSQMKKNGTSRHALAIVSHQQLVEIKSLLASTIAVWVNLKQPPQVLAGPPLNLHLDANFDQSPRRLYDRRKWVLFLTGTRSSSGW